MKNPTCIFSTSLAASRMAFFAVLALGIVSLITGVSPSFAAEPTWTVTQATGDVQYRIAGASWQALRQGQALGAAAEVRTGKDGRAVLTHQTTTMTAAPDSHMALPKADRPKGVYKVFQNLGTLLYRVKKRATSMTAFEVETPFMAAVVKGTVFTVNTTPKGATVHLTEGIVVTQPTLGGQGVTLRPGETARISSKPGADIRVKGRSGSKHSKAKAAKAKKAAKAANPTKVKTAEPAKVTVAKAKGGNVKVAKADAAVKVTKKAVTITKTATTAKPLHVRHPRAVAIFTANNRSGLFAKGVTVETAFKKKDANGTSLPFANGTNGSAPAAYGKADNGNVAVAAVPDHQGTTDSSGFGAPGGAAVSSTASTTNNGGSLGGSTGGTTSGSTSASLGGSTGGTTGASLGGSTGGGSLGGSTGGGSLGGSTGGGSLNGSTGGSAGGGLGGGLGGTLTPQQLSDLESARQQAASDAESAAQQAASDAKSGNN